MRILPVLLSLLLILPLLSPAVMAQSTGAPPPSPTDFDSSAKVPKNVILPGKLDIPANMHIELVATPKTPLPPIPPDQMNNPCLLMNPLLESAVMESNERDVHVVFHWQAGRTSEAFIINGECFRLTSLAFPQNVTMAGEVLDLWLNREISGQGVGGNFPNVSWYTPSTFAGTASLNENTVLVFTPDGKKTEVNKKPGADTYPAGPSLCLDPKSLVPVWICDGAINYTFTYTPAHNVQINPQGPYLKAIQNYFGHYP